MTDKPERLISADKLLEWAEYETWELYCDLKAEIECNTFDPDPPQQPDIQREYERFQQVAKGWNDDLTKAEAQIEQKDAEIARLNKIIKDANDENERLLSGEGTEEYESALTELLKENTP